MTGRWPGPATILQSRPRARPKGDASGVTLAWRQNLRKTRAIMHSFSPRGPRLGSGPVTSTCILLFGMISGLPACHDSGPPASGAGVRSGSPDAGARVLHGEGRDTTPESDTTSRPPIPVGPEKIIEQVNAVRDALNPRARRDAGASAPNADGGVLDAGGQS
jgi:hypothetical protein